MNELLLYLLRGLVYAQSFIWIILLDIEYEIKNDIIKKIIPISLILTYLVLHITKFSFNQYTNALLKFYIVMLFLTIICFTNHKLYLSKLGILNGYTYVEAICLSFLVVFINSYYWEFIMHFNAIIYYGISFNQLIQAFHLIPAYLLYKRLEIFDKKGLYKLLIIGLIISNLNFLAHNFINRFWFYGIPINQQLFNNITRITCLYILICAIINHTRFKKKRELFS